MYSHDTDYVYDQHLVLRCRQNEPAAFDELLRRWQERLWRHARRLTGDSEAAWDVLQETFLAVSQGIWRLEDAAYFRTWVYSIATHKSMDWLRRREREKRRIEEYASAVAAGADCVKERGLTDDLSYAIAQLPPEDQSILSLRYDGELSTVEIAKVLEIPEGTVKSRLYTVRRKLRELMERENGR